AAAALGYSITAAFYLAALASLIGVLLFWRLDTQLKKAPSPAPAVARISWRTTVQVLSSKALFPIIMVGLGGCVFGGLSSFQTSYAASRSLDYSLFFFGFMGAAISSRMLIAGYVVKRDPLSASCLLSCLMMGSIV